MKLRQPKLVDVREKLTERMGAMNLDGTRAKQKVTKIYAHLMFGDELVRVCISAKAAAWTRNGTKP